MNCNDIFNFFQKIDEYKGKILSISSSEEEILNNLVNNRYISSRTNIDTDYTMILKLREKYEQIKKDLIELRSDKDFQKKNWALKEQYDRLMKEEMETRSSIIAKTELNSLFQGSVNINGIYYYATYTGKELQNNMAIRRTSLESLTLEEFNAQLMEINDYFDSTSKKAIEIHRNFKSLSFDIDEVFLNSLVLSLSLINATPSYIVDTYIESGGRIVDLFPYPELTNYVTEIVVINTKQLNEINVQQTFEKFQKIFTIVSGFKLKIEDSITISSFFLPLADDDFEIFRKILNEATFESAKFQSLTGESADFITPFVIITTFNGTIDQNTIQTYYDLYIKLSGSSNYNEYYATATALLLVSGPQTDKLYERYSVIKNYLTRFGEDGMALSALLLAEIPVTVDEILDIIRNASNHIVKYFKGISGLENMNLAIKMIIQSSYNPNFINKSINMIDSQPITQIAPLQSTMNPFVTTPMAMRSRPIGFSTAIYARPTVWSTRNYYSNYQFHPMHSHYMQG